MTAVPSDPPGRAKKCFPSSPRKYTRHGTLTVPRTVRGSAARHGASDETTMIGNINQRMQTPHRKGFGTSRAIDIDAVYPSFDAAAIRWHAAQRGRESFSVNDDD